MKLYGCQTLLKKYICRYIQQYRELVETRHQIDLAKWRPASPQIAEIHKAKNDDTTRIFEFIKIA